MRKLIHGSAITGREQGAVFAFEMENLGGGLVNKAGLGSGGSNGTIDFAGTRQANHPVFGKVLTFLNTVAESVRSGAITGDTITAGTWALSFTAVSAGLAGAGAYGANSRFIVNTTPPTVDCYIGNLAIGWRAAFNGTIANKWYRLFVTWYGGNFYIYLDGNLVDTYASAFGENFTRIGYGGYNGSGNKYGGMIADTYFLRRGSTADEARADYLKYALRTQWQEDLGTARVSPAAEGGTAGALLSNTQFRFGDALGRFQVVDATINGKACKSIKCTTAGGLYIPAQYLGFETASPEMAYGTFEIYYKRSATVGPRYLNLISNLPALVGFNGYCLYCSAAETSLYRYTAGAWGATVMSSSYVLPAGEWVRLRVARRYDGRFSVYINDVLLGSITGGSNPGTDITYTNSSYFFTSSIANDELALLSKRFGECL